MTHKIIPLILLLLVSPPFSLRAQAEQATFDAFVSVAITQSEKLFYRGKFDEAQKYLRLSFFQNFELFSKKHQIALISQQSKIEIFRSSLWQNRSKYSEILQNLREVGSNVPELQDKAVFAQYLTSLAWAYLFNSKSDSAVYSYNKSLKLFGELGDEYSAAGVNAFLIMIKHNRFHSQKKHEEILKLIPEYEKEIEFCERVDNKLALSFNTRHLGRIYLNQVGNLDKAYELYERSLALREEVGFKLYVPPSYSSLGDILSRKGETSQAIEMYRKSIEAAEEVQFVRYLFDPRIKIGDIYSKEGSHELAREIYQEALKVASISQYLKGIDEAIEKLDAPTD